MIDPTPMLLFGKQMRIYESIEEPKRLHKGVKMASAAREIQVKADWTDQGWGNKKARLWLRLYRQDEMIVEKDLFGICQRNDPD